MYSSFIFLLTNFSKYLLHIASLEGGTLNKKAQITFPKTILWFFSGSGFTLNVLRDDPGTHFWLLLLLCFFFQQLNCALYKARLIHCVFLPHSHYTCWCAIDRKSTACSDTSGLQRFVAFLRETFISPLWKGGSWHGLHVSSYHEPSLYL